jgi:hypothetical protein
MDMDGVRYPSIFSNTDLESDREKITENGFRYLHLAFILETGTNMDIRSTKIVFG